MSLDELKEECDRYKLRYSARRATQEDLLEMLKAHGGGMRRGCAISGRNFNTARHDRWGEYADELAISVAAEMIHRTLGLRIVLYNIVRYDDGESGLRFHSVVPPAQLNDGPEVVAETALDGTFVPQLNDVTLIYHEGQHFDAVDFNFRDGLGAEGLQQLGAQLRQAALD